MLRQRPKVSNEHPVKRRVRASVKTRKALEDLFSGRGEGGKSDLAKMATRLIMEEALEGEARDQLARHELAMQFHGDVQLGHNSAACLWDKMPRRKRAMSSAA